MANLLFVMGTIITAGVCVGVESGSALYGIATSCIAYAVMPYKP